MWSMARLSTLDDEPTASVFDRLSWLPAEIWRRPQSYIQMAWLPCHRSWIHNGCHLIIAQQIYPEVSSSSASGPANPGFRAPTAGNFGPLGGARLPRVLQRRAVTHGAHKRLGGHVCVNHRRRTLGAKPSAERPRGCLFVAPASQTARRSPNAKPVAHGRPRAVALVRAGKGLPWSAAGRVGHAEVVPRRQHADRAQRLGAGGAPSCRAAGRGPSSARPAPGNQGPPGSRPGGSMPGPSSAWEPLRSAHAQNGKQGCLGRLSSLKMRELTAPCLSIPRTFEAHIMWGLLSLLASHDASNMSSASQPPKS